MDAEVVKAFNVELASLYDMRAPISKNKIVSITKAAMKAIKYYKHVVFGVERFLSKCKSEYKIAGLYCIDSIIRQSQHHFKEKDVFAPRFAINMSTTLANVLNCKRLEKPIVVRVLNLWKSHDVFDQERIEIWLKYCREQHGLETDVAQVEKMVKGDEADMSRYNREETPKRSDEKRLAIPRTPPLDSETRKSPVTREPSDDAVDGGISERETLNMLSQMGLDFGGIFSSDHSLLEQVHKLVNNKLAERRELDSKRQGNIGNLLSREFDYSDEEESSDDEGGRKLQIDPQPIELTKQQIMGMAEAVLREPDTKAEITRIHTERLSALTQAAVQAAQQATVGNVGSGSLIPSAQPAPENIGVPVTSVNQYSTAVLPPTTIRPPNPVFPPNLLLPLSQQQILANAPMPFSMGIPPPRLGGVSEQQSTTAPLIPALQQQQVYASQQRSQEQESRDSYDRDDRKERSGRRERDRDDRRDRERHDRDRTDRRTERSRTRDKDRDRDGRENSRRRRSRSITDSRYDRSGSDSRKDRRRSVSSERHRGHDKSRSHKDQERERRKMGLPWPVKEGHVLIASCTLWLGRIPSNCSENDIRMAFSEVGDPLRVSVISSRACAYVTMRERKAAYRVMEKMQHVMQVAKKSVKVNWGIGQGLKGEKYAEFWDSEHGYSLIPHDRIPDDLDPLIDGGYLDVTTLPANLIGLYDERGRVGRETNDETSSALCSKPLMPPGMQLPPLGVQPFPFPPGGPFFPPPGLLPVPNTFPPVVPSALSANSLQSQATVTPTTSTKSTVVSSSINVNASVSSTSNVSFTQQPIMPIPGAPNAMPPRMRMPTTTADGPLIGSSFTPQPDFGQMPPRFTNGHGGYRGGDGTGGQSFGRGRGGDFRGRGALINRFPRAPYPSQPNQYNMLYRWEVDRPLVSRRQDSITHDIVSPHLFALIRVHPLLVERMAMATDGIDQMIGRPVGQQTSNWLLLA
ncbi:hypothetical protein AB6A40_008596 [Gnathostoma spinigerum]|uniref:Uncharacterized protein n=1 Tax=Gnathostoma spinigerum TaxID=75299 RepID=A0ABD6EYV7_9BILA